MKRNEHTSARIAKIAALILGADEYVGGWCVYSGKQWHVIRAEDLLSMAGSLVTQAADHKALKSGKLPNGHRLIKRHKPVKRRMLHK